MSRSARRGDEVWNTKPFQATMQVLESAYGARDEHVFTMITAPAGRGKSFAAEVFVERHTDCILTSMPPRVLMTPRQFLDRIGGAFGMEWPQNAARWSVVKEIAAALKTRGGILIVDEADELSLPLAKLLRTIAEESERQVCLVGCPSVIEVLRRHEPLVHRVGFRYEIPPIKLQDLEEIIPRTFPAESLQQIIRETRGNLRHVDKLIGLLRGVKSDRGHGGVTPTIVKRIAAKFLISGRATPMTTAEEAELGLAPGSTSAVRAA